MIRVNEHERGLWFRRGSFEDLILPGSTWLLSWQDRIDIVDTRLMPEFSHPMLSTLLDKPRLREQLEVVELDEHQRAIVWIDGRFHDIIGPGRHAFWKTDAKLKFETLAMPVEWFDAPRAAPNRISSLVNN
jgi:hypothetical protein